MWGVNAASPLNIAQLGYGIGAIFVNLLVQPFLKENVSSNNFTDYPSVNLTLTSTNTTSPNSNIVVPYTITAVLCALIAAGFVYFYIQELKSRRQKLHMQEVRRN